MDDQAADCHFRLVPYVPRALSLGPVFSAFTKVPRHSVILYHSLSILNTDAPVVNRAALSARVSVLSRPELRLLSPADRIARITRITRITRRFIPNTLSNSNTR